MSENNNTDNFLLTTIASTAIAVGCCVLIGKLAPSLFSIPDQSETTRIVVIDANDAVVRVSQTEQGAGDPTTSIKLVEKKMQELASAGYVVVDHRAVLAAPSGAYVNTQEFVDQIKQTAPVRQPKNPKHEATLAKEPTHVQETVPALNAKPIAERSTDRPAIQFDMSPQELVDLTKPPQNEEDLKKLLQALESMNGVLEKIQAQQTTNK